MSYHATVPIASGYGTYQVGADVPVGDDAAVPVPVAEVWLAAGIIEVAAEPEPEPESDAAPVETTEAAPVERAVSRRGKRA